MENFKTQINNTEKNEKIISPSDTKKEGAYTYKEVEKKAEEITAFFESKINNLYHSEETDSTYVPRQFQEINAIGLKEIYDTCELEILKTINFTETYQHAYFAQKIIHEIRGRIETIFNHATGRKNPTKVIENSIKSSVEILKEKLETKKQKNQVEQRYKDFLKQFPDFINPHNNLYASTVIKFFYRSLSKNINYLPSNNKITEIANKNWETKEIIDLMISIVEKGKNGFGNHDIIKILSEDINYSGTKLLELLKNKNTTIKKRASDFLKRLEFGQINISENGVKYLEKTYDLEDNNNPEYSTQRLTAKGDIGIFDNNKILQKYFNLGDLSSEEQTIKPEIHSLVYETLFLEKENEIPEEKKIREKYLQEFKENYFNFYDDEFWIKTKVSFNNLDFKEQGWFLIYYRQANKEKKEDLITFVSEHKENGLKTFLSLEFGENMGDNILSLGEKLKSHPELSQHLFYEYNNITESINRFANELLEICNQTIPEDKINKQTIITAELKQVARLLHDVNIALTDASEDEYEDIVIHAIEELKKENKIQKKTVANLTENYKQIKEIRENIAKKSAISTIGAMVGNPKKYHNDESIEKAVKNGDIYPLWTLPEFEKSISADLPTFFETLSPVSLQKLINFSEEKIQNSDIETNDIHDNKTSNKLSEKEKLDKLKKIQTIFKSPSHALSSPQNDEAKKILQEEKDKLKKIELFENLQREVGKSIKKFAHSEDSSFIEIYSDDISFSIMQKYQEIVEEAKQTTKKELEEFFTNDKKIKEDDASKIIDLILEKANKLLERSLKEISSSSYDEAEILKRLNNYQSDIAVFSSIFQTAYEQDNLNFEQIEGINYDSVYSGELDDNKKEMIRQVIALNYPKQKQQKDILEKVEISFQNGNNSRWHLLIRKTEDREELVSCLRFDDIDKKNVYGATFNVGVSYRGSSIGEAMFDRVMNEVAQEKKIHAIAEMGKDVSSFYLNRGKFNASSITQNKKTGVYYYNIERFNPENEYYGSKNLSNKELMSCYDSKRTIEELVSLQKYILIKKENINQKKNIKDIDYLLNNNYLMTKIIKHKKNQKQESYLIFEKKVNINLRKVA